jgi:hypothetical protein
MKTSTSLWVFVASFSLAISLIIAANMWCFTILGEVNGRRLEKDQIGIWELRWRLYQVLRLHAELFPESPKRMQMWMMVAVGAVFLFGGFFVAALLNSR